MYQLEQIKYFNILLGIALLVVVFIWLWVWRIKKQRLFADQHLLDKLSNNKSFFKSILKLILQCLAIFCFSIALVNPKIGTKIETVKREGVDIVFALDVSKSMLAEDIAPNRLEKSKQLITQIINNLGGDRMGIIGYAGSAFPQVPITSDFSSAKLFLNTMDTDMVSSQGTAIPEAINLATTFYNDEDQTNRVLFIVSDGEDHEGEINQAVEQAKNLGIKIYTIGVGSPSGAPIPIKVNGILQYYKKDENNQQVITKLQEETLQNIATLGGGSYLNGANTAAVVEGVNAILSGMNKKEFESKQFTDFKDQFQWFLAGAFLFLLLDLVVFERKTAWLKKLNLFNEDEK